MASTSVDGQNNSVAYGYTNRLLTAITHNGFGRQTKITADFPRCFLDEFFNLDKT